MTPKQIELLRRCVRAVRFAEAEAENGFQRVDYELIEVGWINGVDPRTATSLVALGLLVEDMPTWADEHTHTHVRLPRMAELEEQGRGEASGRPLMDTLD
jgi:hypothetical protein